MRIAEYKQISTKTEEYEVIIPTEYDDDGNVIAEEHTETRTREVAKMGLVYRDATAEEEAQAVYQPSADEQIAELKAQLEATDYKAIKYAEGWLTEEEYAPIKAQRQAIRDRINELEGEE